MFFHRCIQEESEPIRRSEACAWSQDFGIFTIEKMDLTPDDQVVFVTARIRATGTEPEGDKGDVQFQLTEGLSKIDDHEKVVHEHYSIPAA
jgi:ketosteroid isomerase-like protein